MKISQKGLYALQAAMMLARHYQQGAIRIRDIAYEENLPEKFLELILLEMKNARIVDNTTLADIVGEGARKSRKARSKKSSDAPVLPMVVQGNAIRERHEK